MNEFNPKKRRVGPGPFAPGRPWNDGDSPAPRTLPPVKTEVGQTAPRATATGGAYYPCTDPLMISRDPADRKLIAHVEGWGKRIFEEC